MEILFDASILNNEHVGIAKTLLYLYKSVSCYYPDFHAYGFNCSNDIYSEYGITILGCKTKKELLKFARERHIDVVHYPANLITYPRLTSLKTIVTIHDLIPLEPGHFHDLVHRWKYIFYTQYSIFFADHVITISDYSKKQIIDFSKTNTDPQVIYWSVTLPLIKETRSIKGNVDSYFLYVGGYDRRKGIDKLASAYLKMKTNRLTDSKLIITGKIRSVDAETDEMIDYGVKSGCILQTGYVTDEELCLLYENAICSVYLSQSEGFGLPIIEAMHCRCPVVTNRLTSIPEIGQDAVCYVDRDNQDAIIEALLKIEKDKAFRNRMIKAGEERCNQFDWKTAADKFMNILERCAE